MRTAIAPALALLLFAAGVAMAQQSGSQGMMGGQGGMMGPSGQGMMEQYGYRNIDRNGDGFIAKEEVREQEQLLERLQKNWNQADRNRDGRVDTAEFAAFEQSMLQLRYANSTVSKANLLFRLAVHSGATCASTMRDGFGTNHAPQRKSLRTIAWHPFTTSSKRPWSGSPWRDGDANWYRS
jgi:hypothetical protein